MPFKSLLRRSPIEFLDIGNIRGVRSFNWRLDTQSLCLLDLNPKVVLEHIYEGYS